MLVYQTHHIANIQYCEAINFNFILRINSGRNKITFESDQTTGNFCYDNVNVIAKII